MIDTVGLESTSSDSVTLVNVCVWTLYAYVKASVYKSQTSGFSETYGQNVARVVKLYCSIFPLLCSFYAVVKLFWINIILHTSIKNWDVKQQKLSDMSSAGGPWLVPKEFTKFRATSAAGIPFSCTVLVILLNP